MNKFILKNLIIYSLILGLIIGIISIIPYIGTFGMFALLFLSAPCVIFYLILDGKLDLNTVKDGIIYGAITGFFANITFSFAYAIITSIIYFIFNYTSNFILTTMTIQSPVWLLITFVMFIGVLTATTNAFTGFVTYYILDFIRDIYARKHK
ncbi:hypothetical protein J6G99_00265 [bacterium]|nr:hypothetical protein [bacterium]